MNLILIGYRGTGKTTIAQQLALKLGWDWIDCDVELELRAGKSIKEIFADEGEPAFRDWEVSIFKDLAQRTNLVLATGGGIIVRDENMELLKHSKNVIWLTASVETIVQRMKQDQTTQERRPNLTAFDATQEVKHMLAQRNERYQQASNYQIETDGKSPAMIVEEILSVVSILHSQKGSE